MVFCNIFKNKRINYDKKVTILILIDGFLQLFEIIVFKQTKKVTILILIDGFLQLLGAGAMVIILLCHNPYFNRWFSAIKVKLQTEAVKRLSQSLF